MPFESGPALKEAPRKRKQEQVQPEPETHDDDFTLDDSHSEAEAFRREESKARRQERVSQLREQLDESIHLPTLDRSNEKQIMGLKAKPKFEIKGVAKRSLWQRIRGIFG